MLSSSNTRFKWIYLLMSLLAAVGLWYFINAKDRIERIFEVRLDYKGLPTGLVIKNGQINTFTVRLRGPAELLRSMNNRELSNTVDLSHLVAGNNSIPLIWTPAEEQRQLQLVEITPSRINLTAEEMIKKNVPVIATLRPSRLSGSLSMTDLKVIPDEVTVLGASSAVSSLRGVSVEVPVNLRDEDKMSEESLAVFSPASLDVEPKLVKVQWRLIVSRRNATFKRDIISYEDIQDAIIVPPRVSVIVAVPQSMANDTSVLESVQAYIRPSNKNADGKILVEISVPPTVNVVQVTPPTVIIKSNRPSGDQSEVKNQAAGKIANESEMPKTKISEQSNAAKE